MTIYTYDQDDFLNASDVDIGTLQYIIADQLPTVMYINMSKTESIFTVEIIFSEALSSEDQDTLDTIVANYEFIDDSDDICTIKDIKVPGTNGGSFTKDVWQVRDLNTLYGNVEFATLNDNKFTLRPGKYLITAKVPACSVQNHQAKLYNVTDTSYVLGTSSYAFADTMSISEIVANISITSTTQFEIRHICINTVENVGFGKATGFDEEEVYTTVTIEKKS